MFNAIRRLPLRRNALAGNDHCRNGSPARPACAQPLEGRLFMAADVPLVAQAFHGPAEDVTAVVLTFDVPLDPVTAANTAAYRIVTVKKERDDGIFGDGSIQTETDRIDLASASYDPVANAVTLTPERPFAVRRNFKSIRVIGTGARAVLTAGGTPLDGDGDGRPGGDVVVRYRANARRSLTFRDADGDRVRLRLRGPGELLYLAPSKGRSTPTLFFRDTDPVVSVLSGTVKKARRGDGVADIAQISGTSRANVVIAADPTFRIRALTP
jgi:hypothetical protein